jgi:hypothetical protein
MKRKGIWAVSGLASLIICSVGFVQASPIGMISNWKFDEGAGTIAYDSIDANNGTLVNGPAWAQGIVGGALSFDGINDYVSIPASDSRNDLTAFTIGAWVKPNKLGSFAIVDNQFEDPSGFAGKIFFYLTYAPEGVYTWGSILVHTRNEAWGPWVYNPNIVPAVGEWSYLVTAWDGSTQSLYLNGELIASGTTWFHDLPGSYPLAIGGKEWDMNQFWNGEIDEVEIYNRALSASEIRGIYADTIPEPATVVLVGFGLLGLAAWRRQK